MLGGNPGCSENEIGGLKCLKGLRKARSRVLVTSRFQVVQEDEQYDFMGNSAEGEICSGKLSDL